jgi:hypothetical protein
LLRVVVLAAWVLVLVACVALVSVRPVRSEQATDFERAGMTWWNSMAEVERRDAINKAGPDASVADAYRLYLASQASGGECDAITSSA